MKRHEKKWTLGDYFRFGTAAIAALVPGCGINSNPNAQFAPSDEPIEMFDNMKTGPSGRYFIGSDWHTEKITVADTEAPVQSAEGRVVFQGFKYRTLFQGSSGHLATGRLLKNNLALLEELILNDRKLSAIDLVTENVVFETDKSSQARLILHVPSGAGSNTFIYHTTDGIKKNQGKGEEDIITGYQTFEINPFAKESMLRALKTTGPTEFAAFSLDDLTGAVQEVFRIKMNNIPGGVANFSFNPATTRERVVYNLETVLNGKGIHIVDAATGTEERIPIPQTNDWYLIALDDDNDAFFIEEDRSARLVTAHYWNNTTKTMQKIDLSSFPNIDEVTGDMILFGNEYAIFEAETIAGDEVYLTFNQKTGTLTDELDALVKTLIGNNPYKVREFDWEHVSDGKALYSFTVEDRSTFQYFDVVLFADADRANQTSVLQVALPGYDSSNNIYAGNAPENVGAIEAHVVGQGTVDLYLFDMAKAPGSQARLVDTSNTSFGTVIFNQANGKLFYIRRDAAVAGNGIVDNIVSYDVRTGNQETISTNDRASSGFHFLRLEGISGDGKKALFLRDDVSGQEKYFAIDTTTGEEQQLGVRP